MNAGQATMQWIRAPIALSLLIFISAGTFDYPAGWICLSVFSASSAIVTIYLFRQRPLLLVRRNAIGPTAERQWLQKLMQGIIFTLFIIIVLTPSVRYRHSHAPLSWTMVLIGNAIVIIGFILRFLAFRENSFASATITVEKEQRVVSTGPYALVRHPMYLSVLVLILGVPIALGDWLGALLLPFLTIAIAIRLISEERFLRSALNGYQEYCASVVYRLFPGLW